MSHAFGSVEELGDGYGFRKVRQALGVEAFGVNVIVMPPGYEGFFHYHDEQDELYFVHAGTARVEIESEDRLLGPGGLLHVASTTPRRVSNGGADDLVDARRRRQGRLRATRRPPGRRGRRRPPRELRFGRLRVLEGSLGRARRPAPHAKAAPASAKTTTASQWIPITSVCRPSTATEASEAASHGERRRSASPSATSHATNAASPATPVSTPSSV